MVSSAQSAVNITSKVFHVIFGVYSYINSKSIWSTVSAVCTFVHKVMSPGDLFSTEL